jgi:hypothetical protein
MEEHYDVKEMQREAEASSMAIAMLFAIIIAAAILGTAHGISYFLHLNHWWFKGESAVIGIPLFLLLRRMYKRNP